MWLKRQNLTFLVENEDEFLLDAGEDMSGEVALVPVPREELGEDSMAIDEEGRPRFAPARDIVSFVACLGSV